MRTIDPPLVIAATLGLGIALVPAFAVGAPTTSLTNPLAPPTDCAKCHEFLNPFEQSDDPAVSPMLMWRGTMMANSARDPYWHAGVRKGYSGTATFTKSRPLSVAQGTDIIDMDDIGMIQLRTNSRLIEKHLNK